MRGQGFGRGEGCYSLVLLARGKIEFRQQDGLLFFLLCFFLSFFLSIFLFGASLSLSLCLSGSLSLSLCVCLSLCLCLSLCICLSVCLRLCLCVCVSLSLSLPPPPSLSIVGFCGLADWQNRRTVFTLVIGRKWGFGWVCFFVSSGYNLK